MKALLIIDMQGGSFTTDTPRYDADGVIGRINSLSQYFRKNGDLVIFIQHNGSKDGTYIPGTPEWNILPSLVRYPSDITVQKTANDSFYKTNLADILKNHGVREIAITGCATDFCVDATVHASINLGFAITIISDGHTTADRPHLGADKIIRHHNWLWKNMIPTDGSMNVVSYDEYRRIPETMKSNV